MRSTVVVKSSLISAYTGILVAAICLVWVAAAPAYAQQTTVAATVCQPTSAVTIAQPVSDSTVTETAVELSGSVIQANQIEVYIDDAFDHTIPLGIGQTSFSGVVQVTQGTHTIKLIAINICPGSNGEASSVVTYTPPPSTGGEGVTPEPTPEEEAQEPVSSEKDILPSLPLVPKEVERGFEAVGNWLNIVATYESPTASSLTLARATTIAVGGWLLAFGIATSVVQWLGSALPMFSDMPNTRRTRIISWGIRGVGLLMILGGLFL